MGCTSTKSTSKKDLCLFNIPLKEGKIMCKEEGIISRELKKTSSQNKKFNPQNNMKTYDNESNSEL